MSVRTGVLPVTAARRLDRKSHEAAFWGLRFAIVSLVVWGAGLAIGFSTALTLIVIVSWGAAIIGLRYPIVGLLGIGMLCALDPLQRTLLTSGGLLRFNTLNYWLLLVMLFCAPFLLRLSDLQSRLLQLFVLLLGLELAVSTDRPSGVQSVLGIVVAFGIFCYFARTIEYQDHLFWLAVVVGTTTASGTVVFFLQRSSLPFINPNSWSWFPLTGLLAACLAFPFATNHFRGQAVLILLSTLNAVGVFLSGSRGNLLITCCCLIFVIVKIPGISRRVMVLAVGVMAALLISAQFTDLQANALHRLDKSFGSSGTILSRTSGRSDLALAGWHIFLENPFGVGTGGFRRAFANLAITEDIMGWNRGEEFDAHAGWIKALSENSIPGALLLAGYVVSFAATGWRKRKDNLFSLGLLVTATFSVALVSTEYSSKGLWFLAAGVTTLLHREQIAGYLRGAARRKPAMTASNLELRHHG